MQIEEYLEFLGVENNKLTENYLVCLAYNSAPQFKILEGDMAILIAKSLIVRNKKGYDVNFDMFNIDVEIDRYLDIFKERKLYCNKETVKARIKTFLKKYPKFNMDRIIALARLHIDNEAYPRRPHYFISKGVGSNIQYPILDTDLKYKDNNKFEKIA